MHAGVWGWGMLSLLLSLHWAPGCRRSLYSCFPAGNPWGWKSSQSPSTWLVLSQNSLGSVWQSEWQTKKNDKNVMSIKITFLVEVITRITEKRVDVINLFRDLCMPIKIQCESWTMLPLTFYGFNYLLNIYYVLSTMLSPVITWHHNQADFYVVFISTMYYS